MFKLLFTFLISFAFLSCEPAFPATTVSFNNVNYSVPANGDENWGTSLSNYLIAISNYTLQPKGGNFTLLSDVDFGANYGIRSVYFKSKNANPASAGQIRLGNAEMIKWRNAANNADYGLSVNASNWLQYNAIDLADISSSQTLTNKTISGSANAISNIGYSSLSLSAGDIPYSKLSLSNSILNADINSSAGIVYSKLNLSNSIVNADIKTDAGIAYSKLSIADGDLTIAKTSGLQTALDGKVDESILTNTGDIIYASSANTPARLGIGGSGQVLKSVAGVPTWSNFSGGINYCSANPDAEADTTGWAAFADAAATSPVDGTGGSPSSTFTRSTSSPLRGSASFLWTKSAANRQGEGFSYDFTIDSADQSKVLTFSFDYKIASGTYADDALSAWVYDVTNGTLIQPAPTFIKNSTLTETFVGEFQTSSNSTSYRLIVFTRATDTNAYSVQFDNFFLGRANKVNGTPVTDWVSYTPTLTASVTNPSLGNGTAVGFYRRVGDSVNVKITIKAGSTTTAGSGTYYVSLPPGMSIDTSKLSGEKQVGASGEVFSGGTNPQGYYIDFNETPSNAFRILTSDGNLAVTSSWPTSNWFATTGRTIFIETDAIPILGWSSTTVMSNDADTRVVSAKVYRGTTGQAVSGSSDVKIQWNGVAKDSHGAFDTGNYRYVVPVAGTYDFSGFIETTTPASAVNFNIILYKNGGPLTTNAISATTGVLPCATFKFRDDAKAGDYYEIFFNPAGQSVTLLSDASIYGGITWNINKLSGPAQIAASESVSALYTGSPPTGTLSGSFNAVTFPTKVSDSHNAYSGGVYTVPVSGTYSIVISTAQTSSSSSIGSIGISAIGINGSNVYQGRQVFIVSGAGQTVYPVVSVHGVKLLAGNTINPFTWTNNSGTTSFEANEQLNFFSIVKTGNY